MRVLPLDEPKNEIEIFVIVSRISKDFFVWKCKKGGAYAAYINHARGLNNQTKRLFERSEKEKVFPSMYILETVETTEEIAFRHCVAWTKYLMKHGWSPLSTARTVGYVDDLLPETQEIFESISQLSIEEALSEEKLRVKNYQRRPKTTLKKPKEEIKLYVTIKQYEKIAERAKRQNLTLSAFCKNAALESQFITVEAPDYSEYIAEVRGAKVILRQILYAIHTNGKYYPADMENIQKAVDKICEQEEAFREAFRENTKVLMKLLPKK